MRVGPRRFTSTAESSGESNETAAAEWITMSHVASTARCSADNPSPSVLTSPLIVLMRRSVISANALAPPNCSFSRSKASFFRISRRTRSGAGVRLPSRTSRTSSQSGMPRSRRSTSAVPTNPVDPVMAIRLPESASAITSVMSTSSRPMTSCSRTSVAAWPAPRCGSWAGSRSTATVPASSGAARRAPCSPRSRSLVGVRSRPTASSTSSGRTTSRAVPPISSACSSAGPAASSVSTRSRVVGAATRCRSSGSISMSSIAAWPKPAPGSRPASPVRRGPPPRQRSSWRSGDCCRMRTASGSAANGSRSTGRLPAPARSPPRWRWRSATPGRRRLRPRPRSTMIPTTRLRCASSCGPTSPPPGRLRRWRPTGASVSGWRTSSA